MTPEVNLTILPNDGTAAVTSESTLTDNQASAAPCSKPKPTSTTPTMRHLRKSKIHHHLLAARQRSRNQCKPLASVKNHEAAAPSAHQAEPHHYCTESNVPTPRHKNQQEKDQQEDNASNKITKATCPNSSTEKALFYSLTPPSLTTKKNNPRQEERNGGGNNPSFCKSPMSHSIVHEQAAPMTHSEPLSSSHRGGCYQYEKDTVPSRSEAESKCNSFVKEMEQHVSSDAKNKFQTNTAAGGPPLGKESCLECLGRKSHSHENKERNQGHHMDPYLVHEKEKHNNDDSNHPPHTHSNHTQSNNDDMEEAMGTMRLVMKTLHQQKQARLNLRAHAIRATSMARQRQLEHACWQKVTKTREEAWKVKQRAAQHVLRMQRGAELALKEAARREKEAGRLKAALWKKEEQHRLHRARLAGSRCRKGKQMRDGAMVPRQAACCKAIEPYHGVARTAFCMARPRVCTQQAKKGRAKACVSSTGCERRDIVSGELVHSSIPASGAVINMEDSLGLKLELKKKEGECAWLRSRVNELERQTRR